MSKVRSSRVNQAARSTGPKADASTLIRKEEIEIIPAAFPEMRSESSQTIRFAIPAKERLKRKAKKKKKSLHRDLCEHLKARSRLKRERERIRTI